MIPISSRKPSVVSMNTGMKKCSKIFNIRIINSQWNSNKDVCCSYTQNKSLPELNKMMMRLLRERDSSLSIIIIIIGIDFMHSL